MPGSNTSNLVKYKPVFPDERLNVEKDFFLCFELICAAKFFDRIRDILVTTVTYIRDFIMVIVNLRSQFFQEENVSDCDFSIRSLNLKINLYLQRRLQFF